MTEVSSAIICSRRCKSGISGVSLTMRTWQMTGERSENPRDGSGRITSALTRTSCGKPWVSMPKYPPGKSALEAWKITIRVRHATLAPSHESRVPGRRVGHLRGRLIADHLCDARTRHDQPLARQGHQETI